MNDIATLIRNIPDFPKPGIQFKDITTLLSDAGGLRKTIDALAGACRPATPEIVVGVEARGFIFGTAVACELGLGFVPVRKPGKLPYKTRCVSYELEYGSDSLEIHEDAIPAGSRVAIVDDLLATGGTVGAVARMIQEMGGLVVQCAFVIELDFLKGRDKLTGLPVSSLVHF